MSPFSVTTPELANARLPGQEGGLDAVGRVGRHRLREAALEHQQLQQDKVPRQREPRLDRLDGGKSHMSSLNIFHFLDPLIPSASAVKESDNLSLDVIFDFLPG